MCQAVAAFGLMDFIPTLCVQCSMGYLEECDSGTIERLGKQSGFLLRTYQAELAKDPASRGMEIFTQQHDCSLAYYSADLRKDRCAGGG